MPKPVLSSNPTTALAAKEWTKRFAAAVRDAAGSSTTLTAAKAAKMTGPFADNARNFFERTGKRSASIEVIIDSGARYVRDAAQKAAGSDGKLSITDIKKLPNDLVADMLWLRGKDAQTPGAMALDQAVKAMDVSVIADYGKHFSVTEYPASKSLADVLRSETGWDDESMISDADLIAEFKGSTGAAAVKGFQSDMEEIGHDELENADDASTGRTIERLFKNLGQSAAADLSPLTRFQSIQYGMHGISEDGDTEFRLLVARQKDGAWKVLQYQDFPF